MPELPDITVYCDALRAHLTGAVLQRLSIRSVFVLRSVEPVPEALEGKRVVGVERLGKRIALGFEDDLFLVVHLMIAGRMIWREAGARGAGRIDLAALAFAHGTLVLTEASQKKRASLHVVAGRDALAAMRPAGIDVLESSLTAFAGVLRRANRTLKRALTDPAWFDGIGNAYSDEILHAARLSPVKLTGAMTDEEMARLHGAARGTLEEWTARLREQFGYDPVTGASTAAARFPGVGEITAFRPGFAVHGRFGKPCPVCGTKVARIVRAENETNYCPGCQTGGKLLADRSLSRLLKDDWPRTPEGWEEP